MQITIDSVESKTQNKTKTVEDIFAPSLTDFQKPQLLGVLLSENLLENKMIDCHFRSSVNIKDNLLTA